MTGAGITAASGLAADVLQRVSSVVIGKSESLRLVLAGILAGGHVLLEDYPGLGKTLAARSSRRHWASSSPARSSLPTCCPPT